jgi:hypothetical protein
LNFHLYNKQGKSAAAAVFNEQHSVMSLFLFKNLGLKWYLPSHQVLIGSYVALCLFVSVFWVIISIKTVLKGETSKRGKGTNVTVVMSLLVSAGLEQTFFRWTHKIYLILYYVH